jgi:hypothetical protein
MISRTYDMPCETFRFAWRNERFVLAVFGFVQAQNEAAAARPRPTGASGWLDVAAKKLQFLILYLNRL